MARILVVEDNPVNRKLVRASFQQAHELVEAGSLADGLAALRSATFDVVLLDLGLPDGSGMVLLRDAMEERKVTVVVVSACDDPDTIEEVTQAGVTYLLKPVKPSQLRQAVNAVLK